MVKLTEEDFKKLGQSDYSREEEKEKRGNELCDAYLNIIDILREYCDLKEEAYPLIAVWIIGTYSHKSFESYPYLFLNAMRGSGKTRTLKLITKLAKDGDVQASLTEAVLFRTKGTLGIDEFEGLTRRGGENLKELLNAAYKKGTTVKRMKKKKTMEGEEQVVEEFDVYRPIVMANISGMEEVLGDRCITLILERSNKPEIIKRIEIYEHSTIFKNTKEILNQCSVCGVETLRNCYQEWNKFISCGDTNTYTNYNTLHYTHYTQLFKHLNLMELNGRDLELVMPLILISDSIGENAAKDVFNAVEVYIKDKKEDQFLESKDISFFDFISQEVENQGWIRVKDLSKKFKDFLQYDEKDDWLNDKWVGLALRRLKLSKDKRRMSGGVQVQLDVTKAKEKIKMFK